VDAAGDVIVVGSYQAASTLMRATLYDGAGNLKWSVDQSLGTGTSAEGVAFDPQGNAVVTGQFSTAARSAGALFVLRLAAADGSVLWSQTDATGDMALGAGVGVDYGGGIAVAGYFEDPTRPSGTQYLLHFSPCP
jgi:hypothetical protein